MTVDSEIHVRSFEAKLIVDSPESSEAFPVSSFVVALNESGIPKASVGVDLYHSAGIEQEQAVPVSFFEILSVFERLEAAAESRASAVFSVVENSGPNRDVASYIVLDGWVVESVALSGLSANGTFSAKVDIRHPVIGLSDLGYDLAASMVPYRDRVPSADNARNMLDVFVAALTGLAVYAEEARVDLIENPSDAVNVVACLDQKTTFANVEALGRLVSDLDKAADIMRTWFQWCGPGDGFEDIPVPECLTKLKTASAADLGVMPGLVATAMSVMQGSTSVLAAFNKFLDMFGLSYVPVFAEGGKLRIRPISPWAAPRYRIGSADTVSLEYPASPTETRFKLSAVVMPLSVPDGGDGTTAFSMGRPADTKSTANIGYAPDFAVGGRMERSSPPPWVLELANVFAASASGALFEAAETHTPATASFPEPQQVVVDNEESEDAAAVVRGIVCACAKDLFMRLYGSSEDISLLCRYAPEFGTWTLPGYVYDLTDDGDTGLRFYATAVTHAVNVENNNVSTEIYGMTVRRLGRDIEEFGSGDNFLYAKPEPDFGAVVAQLEAEAGITPTPDLNLEAPL